MQPLAIEIQQMRVRLPPAIPRIADLTNLAKLVMALPIPTVRCVKTSCVLSVAATQSTHVKAVQPAQTRHLIPTSVSAMVAMAGQTTRNHATSALVNVTSVTQQPQIRQTIRFVLNVRQATGAEQWLAAKCTAWMSAQQLTQMQEVKIVQRLLLTSPMFCSLVIGWMPIQRMMGQTVSTGHETLQIRPTSVESTLTEPQQTQTICLTQT
jgi:hypothetical protein